MWSHATQRENTPSDPATTPFAIWQTRLRALAARIDWSVVAMVVTALVALWLRLYNINWDANNHLHPDERKITLVVQCLGLHSVPPGCPKVADPANPYFFAYGSFPMYLLALVANGLAHLFAGHPGLPTDGGTFNDYNHITLVGRALSALFDTGTVIFTGLIVRRLVGRWWGVFAAAFVALTAFEIQLAHFYAVDTVLTFFVTLTLFGALGLAGFRRERIVTAGAEADSQLVVMPRVRNTLGWALLTGLALGLAITSKVSAAPLIVPVALALLIRWRKLRLGAWMDVALAGVTFITTTAVTVVATMPYMFLDPTDFWHDVNEQSALASGKIVYPYTIQFAGRTPYLDQLKNLFIWDMGFVMALVGCLGVLYALWRVFRHWDDVLLIPFSWVAIYFGITGGFYTKFSRYQLPLFPMLAVLGAVLLADAHRRLQVGPTPNPSPSADGEGNQMQPLAPIMQNAGFAGWRARLQPWLPLSIAMGRGPRGGAAAKHWLAPALAGVVLLSGVVMTAAFLNIYAESMTRLAASDWIYKNIPQGSVITHEVWDDGLPLQRPSGSPYTYQYIDLNLYDADTLAKTTQLASQISGADVIIVASNRLVASIARVPGTYPMTNHYYQLLYHGGLGFHLAKEFQNYPHLGFFSLPDATADESFSVYDHPTVWIFTRDPGPRMTADQIDQALLAGVTMPPTVTTLASQKTLLLTPQAIQADQASAPLWQTFNPAGLATKFALPLWWLVVEILGLLAFPLAYIALPGLRDRGWGLSKALGILLLSYLIWLPANLRILPYERGTVWLAALALAGIGAGIFWARRGEMRAFLRAHRNQILLTEGVVLAAFLFFVAIRSMDPDLWHLYRGGEKPMELAFLNGILRSRTLPPLDPWFAGGAINYYYFGQFLIATLIQLTGIVPTTAFNLAVPMLFALTISGAISVLWGISGRWWIGLVGSWFLTVAGNLDGLRQWWLQYQQSLAHLPISPFDYWASSRIIIFTINEFPYWSFLYADMHAHVIDLPIVLLGLGTAASLISARYISPSPSAAGEGARGRGHPNYTTLGLAALALGAMACINTWDAPTYGVIIVVALLVAEWRQMRLEVTLGPIRGLPGWVVTVTWPRIRRVLLSLLALGAGAIGLYLPFYLNFQSFVNGIGPVTTPTDPFLFLIIFGFWLFLIVTFLGTEVNLRWQRRMQQRGTLAVDPAQRQVDGVQRALALTLISVIVLTFLVLGGVKTLLIGILAVAIFLALDGRHSPAKQFTYLLIITGAALALLVETIYLRDFLDGGDYERMNTVFKFYYQVWLLFALGAALALGYIFRAIWPDSQGRDESRPYIPAETERSTPTDEGESLVPTSMTGQRLALAGDAGNLANFFASTDQHFQASNPDDPDENWELTEGDLEDNQEQTDALSPAPSADGEGAGGRGYSWPIPAARDSGAQFVGWGLRGAWLAILAVLIFGSSIFLYEGTAVRLQDRTNWGSYHQTNDPNSIYIPRAPANPLPAVPSLDGFAYMHAWYPGDADAITWINMHISGAPTILEASLNPYQWYGRVSIYTGLPSVLGWGSHESQQRYPDEVYAREPDVTAMYTTGDPVIVLNLLHQYHVQYIYVGQVECLAYGLNVSDLTMATAQDISTCSAANDIIGPLKVFQQMTASGQLHIVYSKEGVSIYQLAG